MSSQLSLQSADCKSDARSVPVRTARCRLATREEVGLLNGGLTLFVVACVFLILLNHARHWRAMTAS
jgi:hypothetical protein